VAAPDSGAADDKDASKGSTERSTKSCTEGSAEVVVKFSLEAPAGVIQVEASVDAARGKVRAGGTATNELVG